MIPKCPKEFEKQVYEIKLSILSLFSPDSYYPHSTDVSFCQPQIYTPLIMHFKVTAVTAGQVIQNLLC